MFESLHASLKTADPFRWTGSVTGLTGLLIESQGPAAAVGDFCEIRSMDGRSIRTQVIGFGNGRLLSMPLEETSGLQLGDTVIARRQDARIDVGPQLLGRVLDGFGKPMDGKPDIAAEDSYDLYATPPGPLEREHIEERLTTGIRVIDSLLPIGKGQRVGIFGGSGVGKSTLLGAMVRQSSADVCVIALIGERNREVRDFIEKELSEAGMKRSVVVVATSDRPAPLRIRAGFVALAVSEYFRDQGKDVLLVMDSVTRLAMAQREIGLAAGEPPTTRGYPPSVFAMLPSLLERAGPHPKGTITGLYTVLVEGDDLDEPITDHARSILDGHYVLSRRIATGGQFPAIDVPASTSRLVSKIVDKGDQAEIHQVRALISALAEGRDLIELGAYVAGTNPVLDEALRKRDRLDALLRQDTNAVSSWDEARQARAGVLAP